MKERGTQSKDDGGREAGVGGRTNKDKQFPFTPLEGIQAKRHARPEAAGSGDQVAKMVADKSKRTAAHKSDKAAANEAEKTAAEKSRKTAVDKSDDKAYTNISLLELVPLDSWWAAIYVLSGDQTGPLNRPFTLATLIGLPPVEGTIHSSPIFPLL